MWTEPRYKEKDHTAHMVPTITKKILRKQGI